MSNIKINISGALKKLNEKYPDLRKKTQTDVCENTGLTRPTLHKWNKGKAPVSIKRLVMLSKYLEVPIDELIEITNSNKIK